MTRYLKSKHHCTDADWRYAVSHIEELISKQEVDASIARTAREIREAVEGKRVAVAWSGGKDSIVVAKVAEAALVPLKGVCVLSEWHYPVYREWCARNRPAYVDIVYEGPSLEWVKSREHLMFPMNAVDEQKWAQIIQQRGVRKYAEANRIDVVLFGRRKADGNMVRKVGGRYLYQRGSWATYNCIAEWTHEECLGLLHYYGIALPPVYGWKLGFRESGSAWPTRMPADKNVLTGWRETYENDPQTVLQYAPHFKSGREFLRLLRPQETL